MAPTNGTITLAEKPYELRFDIPALTSSQSVLKAMGYKRENVWSLADVPYDLGEEIILFVNGVNGVRRMEKSARMMTAEEAQDLFQAHFDWLSDKISSIEDETEAMKMFQDEHTKIMDSLAEAVKKSIGFQRRGAKGGSPTNPVG
jgi:hypothetical protein